MVLDHDLVQRVISDFRNALSAAADLGKDLAAQEMTLRAEQTAQRALVVGDLALLETAIQLNVDALRRLPSRWHATSIIAAIADELRLRFEFTNRRADLSGAMELLDEVQQHLDASRFEDRDQLNAVAASYVDCFWSGLKKDASRLTEAVRIAEELRDQGKEDPGPWRYANTLASAHHATFTSSGKISHLDDSSHALRDGLALIPPSHPDRVAMLTNAAQFSLDLFRLVRDPEVRRYALECSEEATRLLQRSPSAYLAPRVQLQLAQALIARAPSEEVPDAETVDRAEIAARAALASAAQSGLSREWCQITLADIRVAQADASDDGETALALLRDAASLYRRAALDPDDPDVTVYPGGPASCLRRIATLTRRPEDIEAGVAEFRMATTNPVAFGAGRSPTDIVLTSLEWSRWAIDRHADDEAIEACTRGIDALRRTLPMQTRRAHKELWLETARDLSLLLGYAHARRGEGRRAAEAVEAGRTVLISAATRASRSDDDQRVFMTEDLLSGVADAFEPSWPAIQRVASGRALCYITPTFAGGYAIVVGATPEPHVVMIPELTDAETTQRVADLSDALRAAAAGAGVSAICEWIWRVALHAVYDVLAGTTIDHVVLIPAAGLAELPLHAADLTNEGAPSIITTLGPSARILDASVYPPDMTSENSLFVIVNDPRPARGGDLLFASAEVQTLRQIADELDVRTREIAHEDATDGEVVAALATSGAFHFAGHAVADPQRPENSRLEVAGEVGVDVARLSAVKLSGHPLVTLSACETAAVGRALPEEAIGIPLALLQSGASAVVATMWPVIDSPAVAYLFARFYTSWLKDGDSPGRALAEAMSWVRRTSRADMALAYPLVEPTLCADPLALGLMRSRFTTPDQWAAFVCIGLS